MIHLQRMKFIKNIDLYTPKRERQPIIHVEASLTNKIKLMKVSNKIKS